MIKPRSTREHQGRINALANAPLLVIDGKWGPKTEAATQEAMKREGVATSTELFDPFGIDRIHWHWTGGAYGVIQMEHRRYNALIDQNGNAHEGAFSIEMQANYGVGRAASHTLNFNSHAAGFAVDCMAGAIESPFNPGSAPMTKMQLMGLVRLTAETCENYWIPPTRFSVLSHAEIQPTFGVRQKWKWDITWLPGMDRPGDPIVVGDHIREMVRVEMGLPLKEAA